MTLLAVESVPRAIAHSIFKPSPLSLSICRFELPEIVFVIFVQVSAVNEPVSVAYFCGVPSPDLRVT